MNRSICVRIPLLCVLLLSAASAHAAERTDRIAYSDSVSAWVLGQVASVTNVDTNVVESQTVYNAATALPHKTYAFGRLKTTLTHHADGSIASVSDARDSTTYDTTVAYANWKRGVPQLVAYPDGTRRTAVVDDLGQVASATDETGGKTCYAYDAIGRLASIHNPSETTPGVCDASAWNPLTRTFVQSTAPSHGLPAGHWREEESTGQGRKVVYYDALWRPVLTHAYDNANSAATSSKSVTRYDADGRVAFLSYPMRTIADVGQSLAGTRTAYDALGRVIRVEQDSELGALVTTTGYLHDAQGPYTRVTNPRGHSTRTWFQMFDTVDYTRPVSIVHPGSVTAIARDVFGKPTSISRRSFDGSVSNTRRYTYNAYQELCRTNEPETGDTFVGLDLAGNVAWSASGFQALQAGCSSSAATAARRVDRSYDARNRLVALSFPDGLGDTTHTYTPDGLPATLTADNGGGNVVTTAYAYNRRRLLTSERMDFGAMAWTVGHAYDINGHLGSQTFPGGLVVAYAPNALGQPTKAGSFATNVTWHPNGALHRFTYGNGLVHETTQNVRQLPARTRDAIGATAVLDDGYDYDANANVAAISDGLPGHRGDRDMVYDAHDRLKSAASPMFNGTILFGHDVLDNIIASSAPGRSHRYCYDARQRLAFARVGGATTPCDSGPAVAALEYDAQGNLAQKNDVAYRFDFGNRLRSTSGGVASSYVYDAHGRRVRDTTTGSRYSLYTSAGQLAFTNGRKAEFANYIHLGGRLVATRTWPHGTNNYTVRYQHTDALGTPVAVTDANRIVVERSEYEPYGKLANKPARDGVGFTGHVEDGATGLVYMQQRYMDPMFPRFLSVDAVTAFSIGDPRHFNRYIYAYINPYKFNDPDGRIANFFVKAGVDFALKLGIQYATTGEIDLGAAAIETGKGMLNPMKTVERARDLGRVLNVADTSKVSKASGPYKRPSYSTTREQRQSVQGKPCVKCGAEAPKQVAGHKEALVKEHHERGSIDREKMRSLEAVQPECPTCSSREGADMSRYSRGMNEQFKNRDP